jgi:hypothetical protein
MLLLVPVVCLFTLFVWANEVRAAEIDPNTVQKLLANDGSAEDLFGLAVDVDGDTAVIGAPALGVLDDSNYGGAYVFIRVGGLWKLQQKIAAPEPDADSVSYFGYTVAVSGDTIAINASENTGTSVYIFNRLDGIWHLQQKILGDTYSWSLALDGDNLIIGGQASNAARIFVRSNNNWEFKQELVIFDDYSEYINWDYTYWTVAIDGDTIVAGNAGDDSNNKSGPAYVFKRSGDGTWNLQQKLVVPDSEDNYGDGISVAVSGDIIAIGRSEKPDSAGREFGSVYVFVLSEDEWVLQERLIAYDGTEGDGFGSSVSISGDKIAVGSYGLFDGFEVGYAYILTKNSDGTWWRNRQKLSSPSGNKEDYFGDSIAMDGDTVFVGAPADDENGEYSGSVYVYNPPDCEPWNCDMDNDNIKDQWDNCPVVPNYDQADSDNDLIGDICDNCPFAPNYDQVDNDNDLIGDTCDNCPFAPNYDQADNDNDLIGDTCDNSDNNSCPSIDPDTEQKIAGNIDGSNLWFGGAVVIDKDTAVVSPSYFEDGHVTSILGIYTRSSGGAWKLQQEFTLPGYCNVAISGNTIAILSASNDGPYEVYIYIRSDNTWSLQEKITEMDDFNFSIALDGDILVIGAEKKKDDMYYIHGYAYVYKRSDSGNTWILKDKLIPNAGENISSWFDDDTRIDIEGSTIAIGAPGYDSDNNGAVYIYTSSDKGNSWGLQQKITGSDADPESPFFFGADVSLNKDTLAVSGEGDWGNWNWNNGGPVYIFTRSNSVWSQQQKIMSPEPELNNGFGWYVSVDQDTLLVSADCDYDKGKSWNPSGAAYVYTRSGNIWNMQQKLTSSDAKGGDYFGSRLFLQDNTAIISGYKAVYAYQLSTECGIDTDGDGIKDDQDNCPSVANPNQEDNDGDGIGNVCDSYTVTPSPGANGSISPESPQTVDYGDTTSFTVTPDTGYSIASVEGCEGSLSDNIYTIAPASADCTVTASFVINSYTVTPSAGANGSISPNTPQSVEHGDTINFTLTPDSGYGIDTVEGCNGFLNGNVYTTGAITSDCEVTASFITAYTVIPKARRHGSISPNTPQQVSEGHTASFSVTPDAGYSIRRVRGCGGSLDGNIYTTGPITRKCRVTASFKKNPVVTAKARRHGSIAPSGRQTVSEGTVLNFTVTPDAGYTVKKVRGCGGTLSGNVYTTKPIDRKCKVRATFTKN